MLYICVIEEGNSQIEKSNWIQAFVKPITDYSSDPNGKNLIAVDTDSGDHRQLFFSLSHPNHLKLYGKRVFISQKERHHLSFTDAEACYPLPEPQKKTLLAVSFHPEPNFIAIQLDKIKIQELLPYRLLIFREPADFHIFSERVEKELEDSSKRYMLKKIGELQKEKEELYEANRWNKKQKELMQTSLDLIRKEFQKDLKWYKDELEKVIEWYKSKYEVLPPGFLRLGKWLNSIFRR